MIKKGGIIYVYTPLFYFILAIHNIYFINEKTMKINVNHPSFISFLENITSEVLSNISTKNYFKLTHDKKMGVLYMVYKLLKKSVTVKTNLSDNEMKAFLVVLCKKNEENENYEFAAILNDIINNYDAVCEFTKPIKRTRKAKVDKSTNA